MDHSTMLANLKQDLIEKIGEWLDSNTVTFEETANYIDSEQDDELHIKMAEAAIDVYSESRGLMFFS